MILEVPEVGSCNNNNMYQGVCCYNIYENGVFKNSSFTLTGTIFLRI